MWNSSGFTLPSVLIVESGTCDVFIVENKKSKSTVDKILKNDYNEKSSGSSRRRQRMKLESRESSPVTLKKEIKEEQQEREDDVVVEYLDDESMEPEVESYCVPFIDPSIPYNDFECKTEPTVKIEEVEDEAMADAGADAVVGLDTGAHEATFDGRWSSDDEADNGFPDSDNEPLATLIKTNPKPVAVAKPGTTKKKKKSSTLKTSNFVGNRGDYWSHKSQSLVGKICCKFCDTIFRSKKEKSMHRCEWLKCNPKNFICRVCGKELNRNTFSNHLHETSNCHYCGKKFVNPRNMKQHIERQHKDEEFIPPKVKTLEQVANEREACDTPYYVDVTAENKVRKRWKEKKGRYECDLCGKYLVSLRSMAQHIGLHTGQSVYICENCGEKFYTPNGIKGHSCEKKRKRPEKDFRTNDLRHCRFCDSSFASFDDNKAHTCKYQDPNDPKCVLCRCCGKSLFRLAFNRHMEIHSGVEWNCSICFRKLSTERALKVHMTVHTGNKPYRCKLCPESFINKVVHDRHMRFHGAAVKCFRCEFCFKELSTQTSLTNHVQRVHRPTVQCEICKIELPTREDMKKHLKSAHAPAVCQVCNKSFTLPRYLKMHEKLHYEDTFFRIQCQICSKQLGVKNIKSHVFRKHPDQFEAWQQTNPT